jgi:hypothetical protein
VLRPEFEYFHFLSPSFKSQYFSLIKARGPCEVPSTEILSPQNFDSSAWVSQTCRTILIEKVTFRTEITEDNFDGMIGTTKEFQTPGAAL